MMVSLKNNQISEFADFQTPKELAELVTKILLKMPLKPQAVLEPTCGNGSFVLAAIKYFHELQQCVGLDISSAHLQRLNQELTQIETKVKVKTLEANFFTINWSEILDTLPQPILVIGNPPWITNSSLSAIKSSNVPKKSNFQDLSGMDALTGKSNFDISEWMLLQYFEWFKKRLGTIAVLCKTSVARKTLSYAWKNNYPISSVHLYTFDALKYFGVFVEACLLVVEFKQITQAKICKVYQSLTEPIVSQIIGYQDGIILANVDFYHRWRHLHKSDENYTWRSGIKHDCAKVMELTKSDNGYVNGTGQSVNLEEYYLYPLLKSSDIGNNRVEICRKYLLVTQKHPGENTDQLEEKAPQTWQYLRANSEAFAKRGSAIYRNRPLFSIFGVGHYTFAPWKVAISGFYKKLLFTVVKPINGRPTVFDDTVYFLPCWSQEEANFLAEILNSSIAAEFFISMIFWGDKRPITINLLKRLNIQFLARELGRESEYFEYIKLR